MKSSFEANYSLQTNHTSQVDANSSKLLPQKDYLRRTHIKQQGQSQNNTPLRSPKTLDAMTQLVHLSPNKRQDPFTQPHASPQAFNSQQIKLQGTLLSSIQPHFELASFDSPTKRSRRLTLEDSSHLSSLKKGIVLIKLSEKQNSKSNDFRSGLIISNSPILQIRQQSNQHQENKTLPTLYQASNETDSPILLNSYSIGNSVEVFPAKRTVQSTSLNTISCTTENQIDQSKLNKVNLSFYSGEQQKKSNKIYIGKTVLRKQTQDLPDLNNSKIPLLGTFSNVEFAESARTLLETLSKQIDSPSGIQQSKVGIDDELKYLVINKKDRNSNGVSKDHYEEVNQRNRGRFNIRSSSSQNALISDQLEVKQVGQQSAGTSPIKNSNKLQGNSIGTNGFHNKNILKRHHLVRNIREISQFEKGKRSQMFQLVYESPVKQKRQNHSVLKNAHIKSALNCVEIFNM